MQQYPVFPAYLTTIQVDEPAETTKALAIPVESQFGFTMGAETASNHQLEYSTFGKTEHDQKVAQAYERLLAGATLVSLAESMTNSMVMDDNGIQMARLCIARADATKVQGIRHPSGDWVLEPNKGPSFEFPKLYESVSGVKSARATVNTPVLPPTHRDDAAGKFLMWEADWRFKAPPPGEIFILEHLTDNLYIVVDKREYTEMDSLIMGNR